METDPEILRNLIYAEDTVLENCHIYGKLSGSTSAGLVCYQLNRSRLMNCCADFSSDDALWGVMTSGSSYISDCKIKATGTGEKPVYGISAMNSHVSGSDFTASGKNACGGHTGGNFTECTFSGFGEENGIGFHAISTLNASDCIFRGLTQDDENYVGIGISAGNHAKIFLRSITCPETAVSGYSQTGSMTAAEGCQGYYDGILYAVPELPANDTVVTYTDFMPVSVMTQAEYDLITPSTHRLYVITD